MLASTTWRSRWGPLEFAVLLCLIVGPFLAPMFAPLLGVILTWVSTSWRRSEKVIATVLVVVPGVLLAVVAAVVGVSTLFDAAALVAIVLFVLPCLAGLFLLIRLARRGGKNRRVGQNRK